MPTGQGLLGDLIAFIERNKQTVKKRGMGGLLSDANLALDDFARKDKAQHGSPTQGLLSVMPQVRDEAAQQMVSHPASQFALGMVNPMKSAHKVTSEATGSAHGQTDMEYAVWNAGKPLGYANVSVYKGRPHINMIQVAPDAKRQGVASAIVEAVAKEHGGYKNVEWGTMTPDGAALKAALDRLYKK